MAKGIALFGSKSAQKAVARSVARSEREERAPETIEVDGVWYDRRDTVDALTTLLAEARVKNETYREVIRGFRQKKLAANPTPAPKTAKPK